MTAGLPGAGIGGLFYLLAALFMPVWEGVRGWRGRASNRRVTIRHFLLAGTMLCAIWLTGWLLGLVLIAHPEMVARIGSSPVDEANPHVIGRTMVFLALGTLAAVLAGVELLRLAVRAARPGSAAAAASIPKREDLAGNEAA